MTSVLDAYEALKRAYPPGTVSRSTLRENGETVTRLRIKLPMPLAGRVVTDLQALGVTVTGESWEEARVDGNGWTGSIEALSTTRMGARMLARVLARLDTNSGRAAELLHVNPLLGSIDTAGGMLEDVDWDRLSDTASDVERDVHWALVCLIEQAGDGRTFADGHIELDEREEILATLLTDTAARLGLDLDDWYTYEEMHALVEAVDPDLLEVSRQLGRVEPVVHARPKDPRRPGRGR